MTVFDVIPAFERSLLPDAELEFVVIADTHYMLDPGNRQLEFESRRKQTARAQVALQMAAALDSRFVVHLGDLVQEYPETDGYERACREAADQLRRTGLDPHIAVGNHDVGDKPDPTMPTRHVQEGFLTEYHRRHGLSWYSFDHSGFHVVVLNSQIMNQDTTQAEEQQTWLQQDLEQNAGKRTFLFLHLPPSCTPRMNRTWDTTTM
jgi:hypothetical protein